MSRDVRATARQVTPEPKLPDVQLAMSGEAAKTLLALTDHVGGDRDTTYRRDTEKIADALVVAGVKHTSVSRFVGSVSATKDVE